MLTILLIRSGITDFDCQGRIQGTLDVPLCDDGRRQAARTAEDLAERSASISALYTGPCLSAQQTSEIIGERLKLKPKVIESLHNLDQGLWQGMLFDDVRSKHPRVYRQWRTAPDTVCPPEGETIQEATDRIRRALAKLTKKHRTGTIALVLSPQVASVLRSHLRHDHPPVVCPSAAQAEPALWEPLQVTAV